MQHFAKLDPIMCEQIQRSLETNTLISAFSIVINKMIQNMTLKNEVQSTQKKVMLIIGDKTTFRAKKLMPLLEKLGFWVKTKRSHYMINPLLVNRINEKAVHILYGIYCSHQGARIVLDPHCAALKKSWETKGYNKTIAIEIEKSYESRVREEVEENHSKLIEENEMNKQLLKEVRESNQELRDSNKKLMTKIDEMHKFLIKNIPDSKKEEIQKALHLTIVK